MIKFGTDGWRDIIAEGFTFERVRAVVQAIARFLQERGREKQGLVVGYDNRFLSEEFAAAAAEVLAGNNLKCYLCQTVTPTPVTAYAVQHLKAAGAIMFTASHNPYQHHGIKFIPHYAGPAMPEETEPLGRLVNQCLEAGKTEQLDIEKAKEKGLVAGIEPSSWYLKHLEGLVETATIRRHPLQVVVDPLYGAGLGYLEAFLAPLGCGVDTLHGYRDPYFGGGLPDPAPPYLEELQYRVANSGAMVGLALDGDADRLGIVDASGQYWNANSMLPLLLKHLVENRKWKGKVARTVATTHMLDRLCASYNMEILETPVGFKYIGKALRQGETILGGEESGGLSITGHIPEKDGILAALLFVELLAAYRQDPSSIYREITEKVGSLFNKRIDLTVSSQDKENILSRLSSWKPETIGGYMVQKLNRTDGVKVEMDGGRWCLLRPSGTEPLFRLYMESPYAEDEKKFLEDIGDFFAAGEAMPKAGKLIK